MLCFDFARPYANSEPRIRARPLAEYQMLLRSGCSRRVHHMVTMMSILGELYVQRGPLTKR